MTAPIDRPSRRGHATIERYGKDFISARAREGLVRRELSKAKGGRPELLTREEAEAIRKTVWLHQAQIMRQAKAIKRAARIAEAEALAQTVQDPS